jgi:hypothetical protein
MTNSFLFTTPELEARIKALRREIQLSMNGAVAASMKEHGLHYKKNYGVSTVRLKEIARNHTPDLALAERLWFLGERETMILATLLAPPQSFPYKTAKVWSRLCINQELIEQVNMNLFQHLPYAVDFCLECIGSEHVSLQSVGFTLALRVSGNLSANQLQQVIRQGVEFSDTDDTYLIKTIASCLARFCRLSPEIAQQVQELIPPATSPETQGMLTIRRFVENELIFLNYEQNNT